MLKQPYPLTWLFTAMLEDGRVIEQTPEDRSQSRREIILADEADHTLVIEPPDPAWAVIDAEISRGAEKISHAGREWRWRTYSAKSDLLPYLERDEVTQFHLVCVARPEEAVCLLLRDDPETGQQAGDMFFGRVGGMTVKVPFALPDRLWRLRGRGASYVPARRPKLSLVYERDVTCVGMPGAMVVSDVAYRVGWSADILGEIVRHVLEVR